MSDVRLYDTNVPNGVTSNFWPPAYLNVSIMVLSPRNVHGSVRLVARAGWPQSSRIACAMASVPRPSVPWQAAHFSFSYTARPASTLCTDAGGSAPIAIGCGCSDANRGENDFTCQT